MYIEKHISRKADGLDLLFAFALALFWPFFIWFVPAYIRSADKETLKKRGYKIIGESDTHWKVVKKFND